MHYTNFAPLLVDTPIVTYLPAYWFEASLFLFVTGILGALFNYRNFLVTMMSIELMYLGVLIGLVLYGQALCSAELAVYSLLILLVAACESAVGLGILIVLYRFGRIIDFTAYQTLGG